MAAFGACSQREEGYSGIARMQGAVDGSISKSNGQSLARIDKRQSSTSTGQFCSQYARPHVASQSCEDHRVDYSVEQSIGYH